MFQAASVAGASAIGAVFMCFITPIILLVCAALLKLAIKLGVTEVAPLYTEIRAVAVLSLVSPPPVVPSNLGPVGRLLVLFGPSFLAGALIWLGLRRLLLRAASVDLVQRIDARPARAGILEERQLLNIVEEIAIGSGAPAPRVFVLDTPMINAAALGRAPDEAILLVTSGLLERLDRDETEATIARLVTGLVSGDLHVASGIMAAFHTFFAFVAVLYLPLRLSAWKALGRIARLIATPRPGTEAVADAVASLEDAGQPPTRQSIERMRFRSIPYLLPLSYQTMMVLWAFAIFTLPMIGLWRNRCFWSDAQTVKLTRNPDALARALEKISAAGPPPGAEAYDWLFIGIRSAMEELRAINLSPRLRFPGFGVRPPAVKARVDRLLAMGRGLPRTIAHPLYAVLVVVLVFFVPIALVLTLITMILGGFVGFNLLLFGINLLDYLMR